MHSNRLIHEKSPYLLQHAHNPVNWHPWSEEAFAMARADDKPVFLSIGYATCHWCHVMEKESFEDQEAAGYLNETFICIKVDREERPDIDAVYMAACQMLTGSGGWPLTLLMTPEKNPFFAATYIPKTSRFGRTGLIEICRQVKNLWSSEKEKVLASAAGIAGNLDRSFTFIPADDLSTSTLDRAYDQDKQSFDVRFGGFGAAPKFPSPHRLLLLLRNYYRTKNPHALEMVTKTLHAMRRGGIWDHVGFGFHRYSTDNAWLLPHFEKMLYDQALLAMAYLEAYQVTKDPFLSRTAEEIFSYVLRDMVSPEGAFFSAEDADSEGEEGKYYLWTLEEFKQVLGNEEGAFFAEIFNLEDAGNFSEEATRRKTGANILHLDMPQYVETDLTGKREDDTARRWEAARNKLFEARRLRVHPLKDDKVLTDWNGLMIAALSMGAKILARPGYAVAAQRAAHFILNKMQDSRNRLWHRFRDGEVAVRAHADDFAFFILGLLHLYETSFDPVYITEATNLQNNMIADFRDEENGGFFLTAKGQDELPVRPKELYDGAIPSANSVALHNLLRLGRLTGDPKWEQKALQHMRAFSGTVDTHVSSFSYFLLGLDFALSPGKEVVIVGNTDAADTREMLAVLGNNFLPHTVTLVKSEQNAQQLTAVAGFTAGLMPLQGQATAFVCSNFACSRPTTDVRDLEAMLA
ncbi:MAG: thioredoxin domain-containing protein [Desulfobacterales bacterium]|nr:thioredoxin domain-containing protein [Desulfobacterales bacterium]